MYVCCPSDEPLLIVSQAVIIVSVRNMKNELFLQRQY